VLDQAERGTLPGMVRTGQMFADAADEYLRYLADDRQRKPSTVRDARSVIANHLLPPFGTQASRTSPSARSIGGHSGSGGPAAVERDQTQGPRDFPRRRGARMPRVRSAGESGRARREAAPTAGGRDRRLPEEVHALVRAATSEQDAALFLTAAFTRLRQAELVALRWRDVDFAGSYIRVTGSYTNGVLSTPKSGKVRSVPTAPEVGEALVRIGQRDA
jgi:integrase